MKKLIVIAFVIATGSVFAQAKKKSPIDGKIFAITLTAQEEKKKPEPQKDEVSFMLGKCKSLFMGQAGVAAQADYEYEVDSTSGKAIVKFTLESKNEETQERFSWEGSIDDDKIEGTLTTRKKGKIVKTYNFTGTQKNKKKAKPQPKPVAVPKDSTAVEQPKTE
jgi:hypothetical protein